MKARFIKKIIVVVPILLLIIVAITLWQTGTFSHSPPPEKITIGSISSRISGLVYVAQEQEYFKDQGLDVAVKTNVSSIESLKDLKAGHVDLACCGGFHLVKEAFSGASNLHALTVLCNGQIMDLFARRDRGIKGPEDLRGKTIGLLKGTGAEYFLGVVLTYNHIPLSAVRIVDVKPFAFGEDLASGRVDAVVAWEPYIGDIINKMGNAVITWPAQEKKDIFWILVGRKDWLKLNPAAMEKLLWALEQASKFIKEHPDKAKEMICRRTKFPLTDWDRYPLRYELFLDQGLMLHMEDEAAWMIKNGITDRTVIPDFMNYLDPGPLLKVNPQAVQIGIPGEGKKR
jgi:ABC-type nitrate/sulfonate/bicarbonate transport system substrate-binding protein